MRRWLVIAAVVFQIAALGWMAGKREWILAKGQTIYLRTAPIDPRDPMRGDFVRLRYPFNIVSERQMRGSVKDHLQERDYPVFAVFKPADNGLYVFDYLTDQLPTEGIFLRGRIDFPRWGRAGNVVNVRYGIEQFFVQQGQGRKIESRRGFRGKLQVPMEVQVAVGSGGTAVLKDFRWSPLGVQLEMLRVNRRGWRNGRPAPQAPELPLSPKIKVTLKNVSDAPLALADPGDHCAFHLLPTVEARWRYEPLYQDCRDAPLTEHAVIVLAPRQSYAVELDLSLPRWHQRIEKEDGGKVMGEIGIDNNRDRFRMVYRAPDPKLVRHLSVAAPFWHGSLASQAFNARGYID